MAAHEQVHSLSPDQLESVSGGYNRNWILEGCAATVECRSWCWVNGSWCWSNDACSSYEVVYSRGSDEDYCSNLRSRRHPCAP